MFAFSRTTWVRKVYSLSSRSVNGTYNNHLAYTTAVIAITLWTATNDRYREESKKKTKTEYWEHNPRDFDYYVTKSEMTKEHLPLLLHKFDNDDLEVWPWIWTHPNENGPHHVFIGVSDKILDEIEILFQKNNGTLNILIIASEQSLRSAAMARNDEHIYSRCQCGLVTDSQMKLLNEDAKILMLQDERVIAFDYLTISL